MKKTVLVFIIVCGGLWLGYGKPCIGGKWDLVSNIWFTDCTTIDEYDGRYMDGSLGRAYSPLTASGDTVVTLADTSKQTIYWRLYYFDNIVDTALPVPDSLPLLVGMHCWSDGSTLDELLENGNTYLSADPAAVRVISLTFSINGSGNNSGTWWWGGSINGQPTPWAEEVIVALVRKRITDACRLLADAGNRALAGKQVDINRVYLRGHSMGGSGAYRIGIKYPDVFAAIHCHSGFADFKGPCGAFTESFNTMVGTSGQQCRGIDGNLYAARDYTDMCWFVRTHRGASWKTMTGNSRAYEPPYVFMTHGTTDDAVNVASADRIHACLDSLKYGCTYLRHGGGHSEANGTRAHWMLNFRKNQSYCAFTKNSTDTDMHFNFLDKIGWEPGSIVDEINRYEVKLTGDSGVVDVTPRRLQNFVITPGKAFHYWIDAKTGDGTKAVAGDNGTLTLPGIAAGSRIRIEPDEPARLDPEITVNRMAASLLISRNAVHGTVRVRFAVGTEYRTAQEIESRVTVSTPDGRRVAEIAMRNGNAVWEAAMCPAGMYIVRANFKSVSISKLLYLMK